MKPKKAKDAKDKKGKNDKKEKSKEAEDGFSCGMIKKRQKKSEAEDFVDEDSKKFYLYQIHNLEDRLQRYQNLCDRLGIKLQDTTKLYENCDTDKSDAIDFLKSSLDKKGEDLDSSEAQVKVLLLAVEDQRLKYEDEISKIRIDFETTSAEMGEEIMALTLQLKSLQKYQVEREQIAIEMESSLNEITQLKSSLRAEINETERKQIRHLEQLRNEVTGRLNRLAAGFSSDVRRRVSEKARDTIEENARKTLLLVEVSSGTQEVLIENKKLQEKLVEMKLGIEILEDTKKQLLCRNRALKKATDLLKDELKKMKEVENDLNKQKIENETLRQDFETQKQQIHELRDKAETSHSLAEELKTELSLAKDRAKRVNRINIQLRRLLSDAAAVIRKALESPSGEDCSESEYSVTMKRNSVVHQLSVLFGTAAVLGVDDVDSAQDEQDWQDEEQPKASSGPKTVCEVDAAVAFQRVLTSQRPSKVLPSRWRHASLTPQYRPGYVGTVPSRFPDRKPLGRVHSAGAVQPSRRQPGEARTSLVDRIADSLLKQIA